MEINKKLIIPFDYKNLWIDEVAVGYSYSEVCGLYKPYYDYDFVLTHDKRIKQATVNPYLIEKANEYAKFDELLKQGQCSFNDPRWKSHDTEYINNFPCGDKCKKCGRFFID